MKKIYALMAGALCALTASAAGIDVNFASENPCWTVGNGGVATYADGHLNVKMAKQTNGLYRGDLKFDVTKNETEGYTLDASKEKILAIKFIGKRPEGKMSFEIGDNKIWFSKNDGKDIWQNKFDGSVVTTGGNTIYYYDLSKSTSYTGTVNVTRMNFKIADCKEAPYEYSVDWVKTYADVAALEADKDVKDDGANDKDEANVAPSPVNNETTGKGFSTLADAINAAVDGDVLVVNENQTIGARTDAKGRNITIKGGNADVKIIRGEKFTDKPLFVTNQNDAKENGSFNFENITIDGNNVESSAVMIEASGNGTLNLKNVKLINSKTTSNQGLVGMKGGGKVNAENVETANCVVPTGYGEFFCGTNNLTLIGDNEFSIYVEYVEKTNFIKTNELTGSKVCTIYCDDKRNLEEAAKAVEGTTDAARFRSGMEGINIKADGDYLVWFKDDSYTGVNGISDVIEGEVAPVYYNLQGVRVAEPEAGLYIVVRGNKVTKEIVK